MKNKNYKRDECALKLAHMQFKINAGSITAKMYAECGRHAAE